jgi:hypothetical protein
MTTFYKQERNHQNFTGRVPRQARIGGQWAANLEKSKRIPKKAYFGATLAVLAFWFANFL